MYKVYKSVDVTLESEKQLILQKQHPPQNTQNPLLEHAERLQHQEDPVESATEEAKKILQDAEVEASVLLKQAEKEAESILEEAYGDSKDILEKAKKEGYNEGFQSGKQEGYQEFHSMMDEVALLKREVLKTKQSLAKELEQEAVALVLETIKKMMNYEIEENKEILFNLIEKGLEKCTFTESLVVRVSEEDYEFIDAYKNKIYMMTEGIDELSVKGDAALEKGSIIIETLSGKIDSSINTQIKQIEVLFKDLLKGEASHDSNIT